METRSSKDLLPRENPYGRAGFAETLRAHGLDAWNTLCDRGLGNRVTDHRSSWVRRIEIGAETYFIKTYDYPTTRDRVRGWLRTTALAPSRVRREAQALAWLRSHGFEAPEPAYAAENRRWGQLVRAVLVSRAWPGQSLDQLLPQLSDPRDAHTLAASARSEVERLHRAGFRHRNLDPRNVLARRDRGGRSRWTIGFLDAPRHRVRAATAAGSPQPDDRGTREDWARLLVGDLVSALATSRTGDGSST